MRRLLPLAALWLASAASAQQVVAPRAPEHGAIVANKDGLVLPAGEFTVAELIEATASFLCRNYLYDPSAVQRRAGFALQRPLAVDAPGSEELLAALLAARGLAALPLDELRGVWHVVELDGDPRLLALLPWRTPVEVLRRPRLREPAVTAIETVHVDARALASTLRHHAAQHTEPGPLFGAFAADERLLLLRGHRDQLAGVVQLVQDLEHAYAPSSAAAGGEPLRQRVDRLERELAELRALLARGDGAGGR